VVQVVLWAEVVPVVEEVHRCLCTPGMSVDSLLCQLGNEGSGPFEIHEPLLGVVLLRPSAMPAKYNIPLPPFFALSMWFLHYLLHFLYCSARKPSFGQFGHIQTKTDVGLFMLYPTSLSCHSC
jgi:hypothetical protein